MRGRGGSSCPFDRKIGKKRAAAKNTYTLSVWGQQQVNAKIKQKTHATSPAIDLKHIVPFLPDKAQVHPSCPLCLTFNRYCRFLANQRASIVPPYYALYTNAGVRGDLPTLHISHHATPATHVSACFAAAARISSIAG